MSSEAQTTEESTRKMEPPCTTCLYHSVNIRGKFQHVLNSASKEEIIPTKYIRQIGKKVCTCQTLEHQWDLDDRIMDEECFTGKLPSTAKIIHELEKNAPKTCAAYKTLVNKKLTPNSDQDQYNKGLKRFLYILYQALQKNYTILEPPEKFSLKLVPSTPEARYPHELEFTVQFPNPYLGLLFGCKGKNLKLLSIQNKCKITVLQNKEGMHLGDKVGFKIKTETEDAKYKIEKMLRDLLASIVKKRDAHYKRVTAFRMSRQQRGVLGENRSRPVTALNMKENAKDNYSTKYQHMLKQKSARKMEKEHPKPTVLEEGNAYCVNCLVAYQKDLPNTQESCKYHEGYRNPTYKTSWTWTCCSAVAVTKGSTVTSRRENHAHDGCKTGRHVWKPHRKAPISKNQEKGSLAKHAWHDMKSLAGTNLAKHLANMSMDSDYPAV